MSSPSPPQITITADNRGPILSLVAWTTIGAVVLAVFTKLGTKIAISNRFHFSVDDYLILGALMMVVAETAAVSVAANNGLGRHIKDSSDQELRKYQQASYVGQLFYILGLCLGKLSIVTFFSTVTTSEFAQHVCNGIGAFVGLWAFVGVFGIAFQCHLPHPWMFLSNQCFNQRGFWYTMGIFNIVSDLVIIALPLYTLSYLQISNKKRFKIAIPFAGRILVVPVTILRMVFLSSALVSSDRPFDDLNSTVTAVCELNLSVIVACLPFFKVFMESLGSGLLTSDLRVLAPVYGTTNPSQGQTSWSGSGSKGSRDKSTVRSWTSKALSKINGTVNETTISRNESRLSEAGSQGSQRNIINQTREWSIRSDRHPRDEEWEMAPRSGDVISKS